MLTRKVVWAGVWMFILSGCGDAEPLTQDPDVATYAEDCPFFFAASNGHVAAGEEVTLSWKSDFGDDAALSQSRGGSLDPSTFGPVLLDLPGSEFLPMEVDTDDGGPPQGSRLSGPLSVDTTFHLDVTSNNEVTRCSVFVEVDGIEQDLYARDLGVVEMVDSEGALCWIEAHAGVGQVVCAPEGMGSAPVVVAKDQRDPRALFSHGGFVYWLAGDEEGTQCLDGCWALSRAAVQQNGPPEKLFWLDKAKTGFAGPRTQIDLSVDGSIVWAGSSTEGWQLIRSRMSGGDSAVIVEDLPRPTSFTLDGEDLWLHRAAEASTTIETHSFAAPEQAPEVFRSPGWGVAESNILVRSTEVFWFESYRGTLRLYRLDRATKQATRAGEGLFGSERPVLLTEHDGIMYGFFQRRLVSSVRAFNPDRLDWDKAVVELPQTKGRIESFVIRGQTAFVGIENPDGTGRVVTVPAAAMPR